MAIQREDQPGTYDYSLGEHIPQMKAEAAKRNKTWEERTFDERFSLLRLEVLSMRRAVDAMSEQIWQLRHAVVNHRHHEPNGTVLTPAESHLYPQPSQPQRHNPLA